MPRKPTLNQWLTSVQAAAELGCTRANIWDLIKRGYFPNREFIGRSFLIPRADLEKEKKRREKTKKKNVTDRLTDL